LHAALLLSLYALENITIIITDYLGNHISDNLTLWWRLDCAFDLPGWKHIFHFCGFSIFTDLTNRVIPSFQFLTGISVHPYNSISRKTK